MEDGIYDNITIEAYHENKTHLSATQIKLAKRSLKELDWTRRGLIQQEQKKHFDFGNSFELALLSPVEFSEKVAILKDSQWVQEALKENPNLSKPRASGAYQKAHREFLIGREDMYKIPDTGQESYETIKAMLESCFADKIIQGLIRNTEYQLSLFWTDDETGLKMKTRPDICKRKKNVVINVKTVLDGSPKAFSKDLANYEYPLQACVEISGCQASGLMTSVDNYFWLVVEKLPPFNATIYEFALDDIKASMDELDYLKHKVVKARDENFFPGYSDRADNEHGILTAQIPLYYRS